MDDLEPLSVLVFGAGAIGTYVGGSLVLAGNRVVFIEQPEVINRLKERGLRLDVSIDKMRNVAEPLNVSSESFGVVTTPTEAMRMGPFDVAIFAMKSFDTVAALDQINPVRDNFPTILCLQNGVDNEPAISVLLGSDRVIAATVTCSIARRDAGDIVLEKARGIGIADQRPLSARLVSAFNKAGLNATLFKRAADMKWSKLLANLPGSATAAIVDMTPGEIFDHPGLYALEIESAHEALAVMDAQGIHAINLPKIPVSALGLAMRMPAFLARPILKKVVGGGRGAKMPSFHIDLHAGRKNSEVEYLQGAVVRYGEKFGIPTPVNRLLTQTLLGLVQGKYPITEFSHRPERLLAVFDESRSK